MANPFTRFINPGHDDRLNRFIAGWDALEALFIDVYRSGSASRADIAAWKRIRKRLSAVLPVFREELLRHLPEGRNRDTYDILLATPDIRQVIARRDLIKLLPDARECLNLFVLAQDAAGEN